MARNDNQRGIANSQGKCAGCEIVFTEDIMTPEPIYYHGFYWCTDCYERRTREEKWQHLSKD